MPRISDGGEQSVAQSPTLGKQVQGIQATPMVWVGFDQITGVDSSAARPDIPKTKAFYLENIMPLGDGKLRVVPNIGASLYNFGEAIYAMKGVNLGGVEYIVAFASSGKVYLYDVATATASVINASSLLSGTASWCDQWSDSDILFIDSTGYYDYETSAGWKKMSATGVPSFGDNICVYQDRVWITQGRTLICSGDGGFDDGSISGTNYWLPANGAAIQELVDPSIRSNITRMAQANGLLYLYYSTGVNVISNVSVPLGSDPPTPIWQNIPIQAAIGSDQPYSIVPYDRFNLFASRQGAYMMYGLAAPQLSEDMTGTWQYLDFSDPISAGQVSIYQQLCAAFLLNRQGDPSLPNATILGIWFQRGQQDQWFFCNFGDIKFIVTSWISGVPTLFALIGNQLYQLFAGGTPPSVTIMTRLELMEDPTAIKEVTMAGAFINVLTAGSAFAMTLDNENESSTIANIPGSAGGNTGTFLMNGSTNPGYGRTVGFTITSTGYDFELHWLACDYKLRNRWGTP